MPVMRATFLGLISPQSPESKSQLEAVSCCCCCCCCRSSGCAMALGRGSRGCRCGTEKGKGRRPLAELHEAEGVSLEVFSQVRKGGEPSWRARSFQGHWRNRIYRTGCGNKWGRLNGVRVGLPGLKRGEGSLIALKVAGGAPPCPVPPSFPPQALRPGRCACSRRCAILRPAPLPFNLLLCRHAPF